jgi:hypothetical protein
VPKPVDWLPLLPSAIEQLRNMNAKVVDRAALEQVFKIHRRTAIRLMHQFGGVRAGKTFLVDREILVQKLEALLAQQTGLGPDSRTPAQIRRAYGGAEQFHFPDVRTPNRRTAAQLPPSIQIIPGRLTVDAGSLPELCAQLWIFLETCHEDREGIEAKLEQPA